MEEEITRLSAEIYELAGKSFNINSPQQLGKVLFEDMNLPAPVQLRQRQSNLDRGRCAGRPGRRTSHRRKSSGVPPTPKLKGTYVDALPALIDPFSGRAAHDL